MELLPSKAMTILRFPVVGKKELRLSSEMNAALVARPSDLPWIERFLILVTVFFGCQGEFGKNPAHVKDR
jgi:hypothetical protein